MSRTIEVVMSELIAWLKSDPEYRYGWQANIAIQFQDEFSRQLKGTRTRPNAQKVHAISNAAADNFLKLLTGPLPKK